MAKFHIIFSYLSTTIVNTTKMAPKYPCIVCTRGVRSNSRAANCDSCDKWCHISCCDITSEQYTVLKFRESDFSWLCEQCKRSEEDLAVDLIIEELSSDTDNTPKRRRVEAPPGFHLSSPRSPSPPPVRPAPRRIPRHSLKPTERGAISTGRRHYGERSKLWGLSLHITLMLKCRNLYAGSCVCPSCRTNTSELLEHTRTRHSSEPHVSCSEAVPGLYTDTVDLQQRMATGSMEHVRQIHPNK